MELMETPCSVMPSDPQRAFVIALSAVGLPWDVIADALPPGPLRGGDLTQAEFERYFNEDRKRGPLYAVRLIVGRVLWRALAFDDRAGVAASLAVFKSLKDWTELQQPVKTGTVDLYLHNLTQRERDTFRRLYQKAVGEIEAQASDTTRQV